MNAALRLGGDVQRALAAGRPVVALETTVVTHGLPHPQGVDAALLLEADVRAQGATPATIGVLGGRIVVGMTRDELEHLATTSGVTKLNTSNLAAVLAAGGPGSTTVAATMFAAHAAGIAVFATGGIGGVHRDAEQTGDVSADLTALGRTPVAVVCAGAKAILDLPRTVELLETLGVPIFGYRTSQFPAFYRSDSGIPVDHRFEDAGSLAAAVRAHFGLGLGTGVVVGNPIAPEHELPKALVERSLASALAQAKAGGVSGRALTPFLLEAMRKATAGASVSSNVELLRSNARVAAELARELLAASPHDS